MQKIIMLICLQLFAGQAIFGQSKTKGDGSVKTAKRYFEIGTGVPFITFRDRVSSSSAYQGNGSLNLHLGNTKLTDQKKYRDFSFGFNAMQTKTNISGLSDWNKTAQIITYHFLYRKLKHIAQSKNKKWDYFAGASAGSNAQFANVPERNNRYAYNFNWLQLGLEAMVKRNFEWKNKQFEFTYQASLPIVGVTVRPQSFVGLVPANVLWAQNSNSSEILFSSPKLSSLHNNFMFRNNISLDMQLKKNKLRLQYDWQITSNTVAPSSLNSIISSINIAYLLKLKNK
jgi:hypothetical protein